MKKSSAIVVITIVCVLIVLGIVFGVVSLDHGELGIYDYIAYPRNIKLGLDLKGGIYAVFVPKSESEDNLETRMQGTASALEELLFDKGYTEAVVSLEANNTRIRVEVPDVDDPETIFKLIGEPASLVFSSATTWDEVTDSNTYITGKDVANAYVTYQDGQYAVGLEFNEEGTEKFAKATSERVGQTIAIYVNKVLKVNPTVNTVIANGRAIITGNYTYEDALALATSIQAGAFDVELKMDESKTITATLGANSIKTSIIAGIVGLALVIIFMCVFYRLMGVSASVALLIYATFYLFFLSIFPWVQLTLAGIAGVILSIGMAVDGNIIVFSRIRDEYGLGNDLGQDIRTKNMSVHAAIKAGFRKATPAIIDGNVTTVLGCIVMLFVGGSSIKSFAITLLIGVVFSVLSVLLLSRVLLYSVFALSRKTPAEFNLPHVVEEQPELVTEGGQDNE